MYPNLIGKKYVNLSNNSTNLVISQDDDVALLDDNMSVSVVRLLDKSIYDDYIDPSEFLTQSAYNLLSEKIKALPDEVLAQMDQDNPIMVVPTGYDSFNPGGESLIIDVDPSDERRLLEAKIAQMGGGSPLEQARIQTDQLQSIIDSSDNYMEVDGTKMEVIKTTIAPKPTQAVEDPIYVMFKGVKRSNDFRVDITINDMIPRIDFIEMMEDSYNTSIIEYLADEFTNKLLADPAAIKQIIVEKINNIVYADKTAPDVVKSTVKKDIIKKTRTPRSSNKLSPKNKLTP